MADDNRWIPVPLCKPLRVTEWISAIICFILIFFTRNYTSDQIPILTETELIFLFVTFGTLTVLTGGDVFSQLVKEPTSNVPMILVSFIGIILSFAAGTTLVITYNIHLECKQQRILSALGLIIVGSFFSVLIFLIDAIVLIRFVPLSRRQI